MPKRPGNMTGGILPRLLGVPYALAMRIRNRLYRSGIKKRCAAPLPVICVGNITTGGTGKTPMVAWVTAVLAAAGRSPAILTRGYKSAGGRSDEAELLTTLTGAAVVVNPDRVAGAREAASRGADVVVMDDGFQHLRLERDLDIVLVDATNPFGGGACLPLGRLREPLSGLARAGAVVITRTDQADPSSLDRIRQVLATRAPAAITATAVHRPAGVVDPDGNECPPVSLRGRSAFLFCGLGNPGAFFKTAEAAGVAIAGTRALPDHARYDPARIGRLNDEARAAGAAIALTTRKDAVKLDAGAFDPPLFQLAVEMQITRGEAALKDRIAAALGDQ